MRTKLSAALICLTIAIFLSCSDRNITNILYVQNTMNGFTNAPRTPTEKADLVKKTGYDGLEGMGYDGFFELKKALDEEGLAMPVNYVGLKFEAVGVPDDISMEEIKSMIKASEKGAVVYFYLQSDTFKYDSEPGDSVVASILRELSDYSAPFGVKLCVYPHVGAYCETVSHSVKLAKIVNRQNYGAVMNLCHLLKVEGSEGLDDKIKEFTPFLYAVNICGADDGDTRHFGWDRLIRPLGQGSFDTYHFVKLLRDNCYSGPFGLQCYNLKGDATETLTRSMEAWNEYKRWYASDR